MGPASLPWEDGRFSSFPPPPAGCVPPPSGSSSRATAPAKNAHSPGARQGSTRLTPPSSSKLLWPVFLGETEAQRHSAVPPPAPTPHPWHLRA